MLNKPRRRLTDSRRLKDDCCKLIETINRYLTQHGKLKSVRIIIILFALLITALLSLLGRCFYLQLFKSDHYRSISIDQQQKRIFQRPQRGAILDCRGRVLAASNELQIVFAEPRIIKDPKSVSNRLQPILDMPAHKICRLITESGNPGFVKIKSGLDPDRCSAAGRIHGIGIQSDWQRYYPTGPLAAHVAGFTSADNRGLGGVELRYDKKLTGSPGENIFFADVLRRPIRLKEQKTPLVDAVGLILALDATIQQFARQELLAQYESCRADSAVAVVAQPRTGAILAIVSLPDFDPADIASADANNLRNRALTDAFEPGSIIKPIVAAVALDAGLVTTDEKIFCENGSYRGRGFGRIGEYRRGFGDLTLRQILANSSNIGMAKIGQRLGKKRLYEGLKRFGFGKKTGIDLPGEALGLLKPPQEWTGYSVTRIPFGQEISVTAIQLIQAFCTIANAGVPVRPYVVKAVVDNNGNIVKLKQPPPPIGFVVNPQVAEWIISDALVAVVNEGTGRRARLDGWQVFGKTGTAQLAKTDSRGYSQQDYIASFIAGAPADDPKVLVLVSIRKPDVSLGKGYTGGRLAAPVAAAILKKTLNYLERNEY